MSAEKKPDAPHCPAAFINAIYEEHDFKLAIKYLQQTWNELCAAQKELVEEKEQYDRLLKQGRVISAQYEQALALRGEPVAWRWQLKGSGKRWGFAKERPECLGEEWIVQELYLHAAPISGERVREALPCKCGLKTVPQGVDGVLWYWQRHARDECTLELPNEKCWCGLLRSEHKEGHADALPLAAIQGETNE